MQRNRLQFKTRHPYLPIVRYDVFPGAVPPDSSHTAHIIGKAEAFEQLPLPEPSPHAKRKQLYAMARTRAARRREPVYVPWEESA